MFNWEGFENREFCVDFKNDADKMEFLKECEKRGYVGCNTGRKPTEMTECKKLQRSESNFNSKHGLVMDQSDLPCITYATHPIDCSIAENYMLEHTRMCESFNACGGCPIRVLADKEQKTCMEWRSKHAKLAVEILQVWSDKHPMEPVVTYLEKLLEVFPNVALNPSGAPRVCREQFENPRIDCKDFTSCKECWSQAYKEV